MKRRGFLQMISAAAVTPLIPSVAPAATAVTYNRYTYGLAVFHARTRAHVSARGIAHCLKVTQPQAEAMIAEMAQNGLVKPVFGGPNVRAVSNILRPDTWGLEKSARQARAKRRQERTMKAAEQDTLLGHLRQMCVDYGMTLSPRCAGGFA